MQLFSVIVVGGGDFISLCFLMICVGIGDLFLCCEVGGPEGGLELLINKHIIKLSLASTEI